MKALQLSYIYTYIYILQKHSTVNETCRLTFPCHLVYLININTTKKNCINSPPSRLALVYARSLFLSLSLSASPSRQASLLFWILIIEKCSKARENFVIILMQILIYNYSSVWNGLPRDVCYLMSGSLF